MHLQTSADTVTDEHPHTHTHSESEAMQAAHYKFHFYMHKMREKYDICSLS